MADENLAVGSANTRMLTIYVYGSAESGEVATREDVCEIFSKLNVGQCRS
jgi:hypothetical protein